ncbi:hypothetical protein DESACE_00995 [Desulfurella acetivorans A63]|nr:hypothetical protein DESACE_00995 [Desulfurella acetivorans A63]
MEAGIILPSIIIAPINAVGIGPNVFEISIGNAILGFFKPGTTNNAAKPNNVINSSIILYIGSTIAFFLTVFALFDE